jgi:hypothetical protein
VVSLLTDKSLRTEVELSWDEVQVEYKNLEKTLKHIRVAESIVSVSLNPLSTLNVHILRFNMMSINVADSDEKIYRDIAPRVGLDSTLSGNDITEFNIYRARIPTALFKAIVEDLDIVMNQYGGPHDHKIEEARSRFLAPVSP